MELPSLAETRTFDRISALGPESQLEYDCSSDGVVASRLAKRSLQQSIEAGNGRLRALDASPPITVELIER